MQDFNMQRVKVYRLNRDGLWDDKGTGHVSMEYMEQSDSVGLVVISEEDTRTLLIHRISRDDIYQQQGDDTIITWSDPEVGTDIALSFQEARGCNYVWGQILEVQGHFNQRDGASRRRGAVDEFDNLSTGAAENDGTFTDSGVNAVELPAPELANLSDIVKVLMDCSPFLRETVAQQMLRGDYIRKLLDVFKTAEDLEDTESLGLMYKAMKGAIMLNDTSIFEILLREENVMDVVGALEYDPENPTQQKYREFLRDSVVFKEVVPVRREDVRAKIHQTYRIGYIKDVILPRVLDDTTFATLSSLMMFNNVEVLMCLQADERFMQELFTRLKNTSPTASEWRDLVSFLQELCSLAKHLQAAQRGMLFQKLCDLGMLDVTTQVMRTDDAELRLRGTDVLLSAMQHDPTPLRMYLQKQEDHALFSLLVRALVEEEPKSGLETSGGLQEQVLEMLRLLLDPETMEQNTEKNDFLELFYDKYIDTLVQTLVQGAPGCDVNLEYKPGPAGPAPKGATAATLALVVELLCFCVQHHSYRIKYYILRNNVVEKVLRLLKCRQKWLVVSAVRFLRTCIGMKDEFYNRYLVRHNLLDPVVKAFVSNGCRYNLLNSAVLELVDFVRKENIKGLISYLVERFYDNTFDKIDYVETFKQLKLKYDQVQEGATGGAAAGGAATATQNAREVLMANRRRRDNDRGLDKDEEDYFNEDDGPTVASDSGPAPAGTEAAGSVAEQSTANGTVRKSGSDAETPSGLLGLLAYGDDDDSEDEAAEKKEEVDSEEEEAAAVRKANLMEKDAGKKELDSEDEEAAACMEEVDSEEEEAAAVRKANLMGKNSGKKELDSEDEEAAACIEEVDSEEEEAAAVRKANLMEKDAGKKELDSEDEEAAYSVADGDQQGATVGDGATGKQVQPPSTGGKRVADIKLAGPDHGKRARPSEEGTPSGTGIYWQHA